MGGSKHRSHAMTSSEIFEKKTFVGQRYRGTEDQMKPWPGLALDQDFTKGRVFKSKVKRKVKTS